MTLRSKLFATVAMPVLSAAMIIQPAMAASMPRSFEVAQATEEELQAQQAEEQKAAEAAEQQRILEEQKAAEDAARAAEQQAAEQQAAEQQAAEEAARAAEQQAADEAAKAAADQQAAEQQAAEDAAKAAEQQAADEAAKAAADQQAADDAAKAAIEQQAADEAAKAAADQQAADDAAKAAAEEAQKAQEQQPAVEEQPATAEQPATEEQPPVEQTEQPATEEQPAMAEQPATEEQPATAEQPATEEQPATAEQPATEEQPATAEQPATGEQPATEQQATETPADPVVVPEIVDTRTEAENQQIAEDPAKTDETVVLPVENGAAVLDSDKDADNTGGQTAREQRRTQRAEQEAVAAPTNDAEAQVEAAPVEQATIQAAITEEGTRLDAAPAFATPGVTNIENNTVNNTVTNNVTNNVTNVIVEQQIDNRTVLNVDNQIIIRSDDRQRLRRDSEESYYETLPRGRTRETIVRPGGARIVTIYDQYGDIVQRSRIERDGAEYLMVYSPEGDGGRPPAIRDIGYELPPMRLRIPVRDYIIDTSSDPDRDYYDFLAEPPVEQVERVYTIDEVKYSARIRDKVRRIDLDTITFASGSAEVPLAQAKTLRKVANAMLEVLEKDPGETFLIEGHTDAVGKDRPNLVLSDQRAGSVAELLTEVYGVPPENLVPQGYGERYLKVKTQVAEQQNRRVTIRRVTALVRPVAKK